jgi:hypothetical protein
MSINQEWGNAQSAANRGDPFAMREWMLRGKLRSNPGDRGNQRKLAATQLFGGFMDPRGYGQQSLQDYYDDPRVNAARQQAQGAVSRFGGGQLGRQVMDTATGNTSMMRGLRAQALGRAPSVVNRNAAAQRMGASRDIAFQLQAGGGGNNPALQRAAMMQQGQLGAQMAPKVAAARAAERQAAMGQYMNAQQGARQQALGMGQQQVANAMGMYNTANQGYGAGTGIGLQGHQQASSAYNENPYMGESEVF